VCIVHPIYERICDPLNCGSMWLDCCCQNWRNLKSQGGSSKTWFCWMTRSSLLASIRKFAASSATDCLFGFGPRSGAMVLPPPDLFLWFCFWFWILLTSHILLFWSADKSGIACSINRFAAPTSIADVGCNAPAINTNI
jgi:hypothetical protein